MSDFNRVILMGHLTRDAEVRTTNSGSKVSDFGFATNRKYSSKDGKAGEDVMYCDVSAWGRQGEIVAEYCRKGSPLFIEGRLNLDQWETSEGQKRSKLTVVAERVQLMGGKREDGQAPATAPAATQPTGAAAGGDLPF